MPRHSPAPGLAAFRKGILIDSAGLLAGSALKKRAQDGSGSLSLSSPFPFSTAAQIISSKFLLRHMLRWHDLSGTGAVTTLVGSPEYRA